MTPEQRPNNRTIDGPFSEGKLGDFGDRVAYPEGEQEPESAGIARPGAPSGCRPTG